jgi:cation diffusion facilitator CzcD-associated flavoprotein CzcO
MINADLLLQSGLVAYRELTREGFNVKLFDRDEVPGGTWHYSDRIPLRAHYSNVSIERAEYTPDLPPVDVELPYEDVYENNPTHGPTLEDRLREHRAQKAVWESLHSNAPSVRLYH